MTAGTRPGAVERSADFVQSLERGLSVIRAFDADHSRLTLTEVAARTHLTRAAARRFLHTLVDLGYVHTDGKHFALRPLVLELGYAYLSTLSLPEVAQPHMEQLTRQVEESCSLSVLDAGQIVYVARVPTRRIMAVTISVGTRFPAYVTSMGRVLLAYASPQERQAHLSADQLHRYTPHTTVEPGKLEDILTQVRAQGYCMVRQELEEGLQSLAVPVRNGRGEVVAALNVSAPIGRGGAEDVRREILPALQETAALIAQDLVG